MANEYRVAESTLLTGARIFSLQNDTKDIQNGSIVGKGDLIEGETSIYEALDDFSGGMYLVLNPAWSYEDDKVTDQNEENYVNEAGKPFRAYRLDKDMKFKVYNMSETFSEGDVVTYDATSDAFVTDETGSLKVVVVEEVGFPYCIGSIGVVVTGDDDNEYGYATGDKAIKYTIEVIA